MAGTTFETRRAQMFPRLEPEEIDRLRRFGQIVQAEPGQALATAGVPSPGLFVVLDGRVAISRRDANNARQPIVEHDPGQFIGEIAQLSGRPSLVDVTARTAVEALLISPDRLRAVLVAEAELGERIMRALILRRVSLIETGAGGPIIIGRAADADVIRLAGFLARNGHPYQNLDPDQVDCAKVLIQRFEVDESELPIVLCPNGQILRQPSNHQLGRCIGLVGPIDEGKIMTSPWSARVPPAWRQRSTPPRRACRSWCSTPGRSAARPAPRRGSRTISAFRRGSPAWP